MTICIYENMLVRGMSIGRWCMGIGIRGGRVKQKVVVNLGKLSKEKVSFWKLFFFCSSEF